MTEIIKLKQMRKTVRSSVTRIETFLSKINPENIDVIGLRLRISMLQEARIKFQSVQADIGALDQNLSEADYEKELDDFEERYYNLAAKAESYIEMAKVKDTRHVFVDDQTVRNDSNIQVKLPKIDLPQFTGTYEDWQPFYSVFNSLIHENQSINNIQKFHYLKSALKGEAVEIITSLEITNENYADAWRRLKERYDNKKLAVQNHIRAIFELPIMKRENVVSLRLILDGLQKHLRALEALSRPTNSWDDLIIYVASNKLDISTIKAWESTLHTAELPTYQQFIAFLSKRCQTLEAVAKQTQISNVNKPNQVYRATASHAATVKNICFYCKGEHNIFYCERFNKLSSFQRMKEAKAKGLCLNCLRKGHQAKDCISGSCKMCGGKHNTMLHIKSNTRDKPEIKVDKQDEVREVKNSDEVSVNISMHNLNTEKSFEPCQVLLSTAMIQVKDYNGKFHNCRALLDNGSQSNFISEDLARKLQLESKNVQIAVKGINESTTNAVKAVKLNMKSRFDSFQTEIQCIVLKTITQNLPLIDLDRKKFNIPKNIRLADPSFHRSERIDLLLGSEKFWELICVGQISLGKNRPVLQKTVLGWIVAGKIQPRQETVRQISCNFAVNDELNDLVHKFWQVENCFEDVKLSAEEIHCEKFFQNNHTRLENGRYVVKLPVDERLIERLGESKEIALKRFQSLERNLLKDSELKKEYTNFIKEYESLGHMRRVSPDSNNNKVHKFFLPHHAVVKESSTTTKLRVVFDASCKSSSGLSLNDVLYKGPSIQPDIFTILIRFRLFKYVLCADIQKMYRQVLVDDTQTSLQQILWRDSPEDELQTYELVTLTYGTKPASFLATRVLQQLADDEEKEFPVASKIVKRDFYVDDLLTGADSWIDLMQLKDDLVVLLNKGGFTLHKLVTNSSDKIDGNSNQINELVNFNSAEESKLLGILWNPQKDTFHYTSIDNMSRARITKRIMLSETSRIFDPLGLLGPIIIAAKILIQQVWCLRLGWDDSVPMQVQKAWTKFKAELPMLSSLAIPRRISFDNCQTIQLHGFSDASQQAYGACIYIRYESMNNVTTMLVCAKSRVAPLKVISLPRLELCGAVLLSRLMRKILSCIDVNITNLYYWTDSMIVLAWLNAQPKRWQTFVSNRVSEIQSESSVSCWRHVSSKDNPADAISRGMTPVELLKSNLWWEGPIWLKFEEAAWPVTSDDSLPVTVPECRKETIAFVNTEQETFELFKYYSSWNKLIRVTAYVYRFYNNIKFKIKRRFDRLDVSELESAALSLIRRAQLELLSEEYKEIQAGKQVSKKSSICGLNPFLDDKSILRVGGRLKNALVSSEMKHPIILPGKHLLSKLIIKNEHKMLMHAGAQSTLASLRRKYWIINGKRTVRKIIHDCIVCCKAKPTAIHPMMGDLPAARVNVARPFVNSGIDYCGPFSVRERVKRNSKIYKAYVAVFVCMATKAVHLELVEDLSTESFLAALRRFISRRGKVINIYTDNATNFVGADRELQRFFEQVEELEKIKNTLSKDRISWHFITPRAPHFGGLWESAVKSFKHHFKREAGDAALTYTEFNTLLAQIEAILNSRPLTALSDDPSDLEPLTPGHFLIGEALMAFPDPDLKEVPTNRLSRWQNLERIKQHFWSRWSREYLTNCQQRTKWKQNIQAAVKVGQLVMLKEEETMPFRWSMARVEECYPGEDGIIRTILLRTKKGLFKRPVVKICPLPIEE